MATIKLRNITSSMAKKGALVRVHPTNKNAFQYVTDLTKLDFIGTIAKTTPPGGMCTISGFNMITWDDIINKPEDFGSGAGNSYFPSKW